MEKTYQPSVPSLSDLRIKDCDTEPIQYIELVQPHGFLLVLDDHMVINRISDNTDEMLNIDPQDLLNQNIAVLLGNKKAEYLKHLVEEVRQKPVACKGKSHNISPLRVHLHKKLAEKTVEASHEDEPDCLSCDLSVHISEQDIIVECEPVRDDLEFYQDIDYNQNITKCFAAAATSRQHRRFV